jgi:MoCo/4Fe-4S cofactor protein with predicted Tat translocation signal
MSSIDKNKTADKQYWRSKDQLEDSPEYRKFLETEFPDEHTEKSGTVSRRGFINTVGATLAFAGIAGCRRPIEKIVPYVDAPENLVLGEPEFYATSIPFGTSSYGLVVTCQEGRPIKIEGNELHPSSLGKSNSFMQSSLLNLYDPDRSKSIMNGRRESGWKEVSELWEAAKTEYKNAQGNGLAVLDTESCSPTYARLKNEFLKKYPDAEWVTFSSVSDENIIRGVEAATGKLLKPSYNYEKAEIIVALDADPFMMESESVTNALGFANGRKIDKPSDKMNRLYVVEPGYTVTGAMADHRMKLRSGKIEDFAVLLAYELVAKGLNVTGISAFTAPDQKNIDLHWVKAVADDLVSHKEKSLVVAGRRQNKSLHALILSINNALGNIGKTVEYHKASDLQVSDRSALKDLVSKMKSGKINSLLMIGGNPVENIPTDLDFPAALEKVQASIYLGSYNDQTSKLSSWHINRSHYLESWGDCRSADGTPGIVQPMIEPLFYGKSDLELLSLLVYGEAKSGYESVQTTWKSILKNSSFDSSWRRILHDGLYPEGKSREESIRINARSLEREIQSATKDKANDGFEIIFAADNSIYDGRYANNGWMQELPDPLTKLIWDNAALISNKTAVDNSIVNGDIIRIENGKNAIEIPVWILPGQADNVVVLPLGYGYKESGRIAEGVGFNVNPLRTLDGMDFVSGVKITVTGKTYTLASTQNHGSMEGRPLIREANLDEYHKDPAFAQHAVHVPDLQSLWVEHKYDKGNQWGMSIDLNACIGCGACSLSCQSENNIPVVGKQNGDYGREMHWMRIDRYFSGDEDNPQIGFQPMACQHCEMAPCEQVCPVAATVHDAEGLNVMTYNRCIGTRYCSNNCAYKVRRFNFFNYTNELPEVVKLAQNPDVTVRSRGVMEKCTYCLQRINRTKRSAKLDGRPIEDGEMKTACQQACPTNAIRFGNILDKSSEIVKAKSSERSYEVLAEFNFRPRTSYQARLRNPNPVIKS